LLFIAKQLLSTRRQHCAFKVPKGHTSDILIIADKLFGHDTREETQGSRKVRSLEKSLSLFIWHFMIITFRKMRWTDDAHAQMGNTYKLLFLKKQSENDAMLKT
jgi:hypothetical protein